MPAATVLLVGEPANQGVKLSALYTSSLAFIIMPPLEAPILLITVILELKCRPRFSQTTSGYSLLHPGITSNTPTRLELVCELKRLACRHSRSVAYDMQQASPSEPEERQIISISKRAIL
jgi:hypothetical protein